MINKRYKHVKGEAYPQEVRQLVLSEYYRGIPRNELAIKYNIKNPTVISHWVRIFESGKSTDSLPKITYRMPRKKRNLTDYEQSLESEIRRLKKELVHKDEQLRRENKRAEKAELKNELLDMLVDIRKKI